MSQPSSSESPPSSTGASTTAAGRSPTRTANLVAGLGQRRARLVEQAAQLGQPVGLLLDHRRLLGEPLAGQPVGVGHRGDPAVELRAQALGLGAGVGELALQVADHARRVGIGRAARLGPRSFGRGAAARLARRGAPAAAAARRGRRVVVARALGPVDRDDLVGGRLPQRRPDRQPDARHPRLDRVGDVVVELGVAEIAQQAPAASASRAACARYAASAARVLRRARSPEPSLPSRLRRSRAAGRSRTGALNRGARGAGGISPGQRGPPLPESRLRRPGRLLEGGTGGRLVAADDDRRALDRLRQPLVERGQATRVSASRRRSSSAARRSICSLSADWRWYSSSSTIS